VEVLVQAQALRGHTLQELNLGCNRSITLNGWKAVASLLEMPGNSLKQLKFHGSNIGDEGAQIFANALTNNSTLKMLYLEGCGIIVRDGHPSLNFFVILRLSTIHIYQTIHWRILVVGWIGI